MVPHVSDGPRSSLDRDGVRIERPPGVRTGVWLLVGALGLLAALVVFVLRPATPRQDDSGRGERHAAAPPASGAADARQADARAPAAPTRPQGGARPVPRRATARDAVAAAGTNVPAADQAGDADADRAADAGEPSGIALFPPPGTNPPKPGIIVPDDFELPPGYVRHYQATDDGQRLPAILMFHPDYEWVDEHGARIAVPADHIVPPELAPPGLPIRILAVPDTHIPAVEPPPGER
jgi:hypothetical protein